MSSLALNKIILCGRLTADLEIKKTNNDKSVASFTLAVPRPKVKGATETITDFITCVAWGNVADFIARFFSKGSSICLEGRLQVRAYTDKNNAKRYAYEVNVNEAYFVDSKATAPNAAAVDNAVATATAPSGEAFEVVKDESELPF